MDKKNILILILFCSAAVFAQKLKEVSPKGLALYDQKMAEYPSLDPKQLEKEAEEAFPLVKDGEEVTVNYIRNTAKGKFLGVHGRFLKVGSKEVPLVDLDEKTRIRFCPEENKKSRDKFIKKEKDAYNSGKLEFMGKLAEEVYSKYPAINKRMLDSAFSRISDTEKRKMLVESFASIYDSLLPLEVPMEEFMRTSREVFLKRNPELVEEGEFFWLKNEKDLFEDRTRKLEEASGGKLEMRISRPRTASPVFDPDGGFFDPSRPVVITCPTHGAEIHYTLDGSEPAEDSPLYGGPVKLAKPVILKAIALHPEYNDSDVIRSRPWDGGVLASFFETMTFKGFTIEKELSVIDFNWGDGSPMEGIPENLFSVIFAGQLIPRTSEPYTFYLTSDDGSRFWLGDKVLIDAWKEQTPKEYEAKAGLEAGKKYDIKVTFAEVLGPAMIRLEWSSPSIEREVIPLECLLSEGKYVEEIRTWNKKLDKNNEAVYINRAKMQNPGSWNGKFRLPVRGGQERWDQLGIK